MIKKDIEVLVRVPRTWLSTDDISSFDIFMGRAKKRIKDDIVDYVVKQAVKDIKIPKYKITKEEIKQAVIEKIAERAVEKYEDED